jgi:signal peptidase II
MKLTRGRALSVGLMAVVIADWATKFLVQNHVRLNAEHVVVDGWFWLTHRQNRGVSFSMLADAPDAWRLPVLVAFSIIGIAVAAHLMRSTHDAWMRVAAGLVIAGAAGNLIDRLLYGAVTDFIRIRFFPFIFNVADVAITAGAILLAARMLLESTPQDNGAAPAEG